MKTRMTHESILNASSHGLIATDRESGIVFANAQIEKVSALHPIICLEPTSAWCFLRPQTW